MKSQPDLAEVAAARATMREMTREAHEAVKDLRAAIRESRAERGDVLSAQVNKAIAHIQAELDRTVNDQSAQAREAFAQMLGIIQQEAEKLMAHIALLLGASSADELFARLAAQLTMDLKAQEDAGK